MTSSNRTPLRSHCAARHRRGGSNTIRNTRAPDHRRLA